MCGRYYIETGTWDLVREDFPEISNDIPVFPSGDIVPSMAAPSLISENPSGMNYMDLLPEVEHRIILAESGETMKTPYHEQIQQ